MHDLVAIAQALPMFWEQKVKLKRNDRHTKHTEMISLAIYSFTHRGKDS